MLISDEVCGGADGCPGPSCGVVDGFSDTAVVCRTSLRGASTAYKLVRV